MHERLSDISLSLTLPDVGRPVHRSARLPGPDTPVDGSVHGAGGSGRLDRARMEAEEEAIRRELEEKREEIVHRAHRRETDVQYRTLHC